jgi:hypothetical protein
MGVGPLHFGTAGRLSFGLEPDDAETLARANNQCTLLPKLLPNQMARAGTGTHEQRRFARQLTDSLTLVVTAADEAGRQR